MFRLRKATILLSIFAMFGFVLAPMGAAAQTATNTYEVTITNLTSKQVFSPPIIATHSSANHVWQVGQNASEGVRVVAKEGMNDKLAAELQGVATDMAMGDAPLMPGQSVTLRITANDGDVLSAATMLVQTNDGFTGLDNAALTNGSRESMVYDAGTEENTELAADVPGPPFGGHMHGTPTNPQQPISMHQGIVGNADVGTEFNWSGPAARFTIQSLAANTPSMPKTGAGDNGLWLPMMLAALALILSGWALRARQVGQR